MARKSAFFKDLGLVCGLLTALCWSFAGIFVKAAGPTHPILLTSARLWLTLGITLLGYPFWKKLFPGLRKSLRTPEAWVHSGFLCLYYLFAVCSFRYASVGEVSLLICTSPLFAILWRGLRSRKVDLRELMGVGIALLGVAVVLASRTAQTQKEWPLEHWGLLLAAGSAICSAGFATYGRFLKSYGIRIPSVHSSVITSCLGGVVFGYPLLLGEKLGGGPHWFGALFGLAGISTAIPSVAAAVASQRLKPSVYTSFSLLLPPLSAIAARWILGEQLHWGFWPGSFITLAALYWIILETKKAET